MTFSRAIVLGGSIAGLCAAAGLAPHFDEVMIVDRDDLLVDDSPEAKGERRGAPQGGQVHHLLGAGKLRLEELVPGFDDDLIADGAERFDEASAFAQFLRGRWRVRTHSELSITCFQRTRFEWAIRRRVLALPNVTALKGLAAGLVGTPDGSRVIGAKVRGVDGNEILGELVVDATGRGSRSPNWIEDLGYEKPLEAHQRVFMGYTTFDIELPDGFLPHGLSGVTYGSSPSVPMGASIRPIDNGKHIIVANGMMRNYPPDDLDSMRIFFASLPTPIFTEALDAGTVTSELRPYQMPGNQRRYWELLERRPEGFVALGDAVASFDPLFGQGMSTAAIGGTVLRDVVAEAAESGEIAGVAEKTQKGIVSWVNVAFDTAVGTDAGFDGEYENMAAPTTGSQADLQALADLQTFDIDVMLAARRATLFMDPSLLATDEIKQKIADWKASGREVDPDMADPTKLPQVAARKIHQAVA